MNIKHFQGLYTEITHFPNLEKHLHGIQEFSMISSACMNAAAMFAFYMYSCGTLEFCRCTSGLWSAVYLCSVVVHGQHAEHVQGVTTLDEFPHGLRRDALASLLRRRRLVAGRIGQLLHADDAVLNRTESYAVRKPNPVNIHFMLGPQSWRKVLAFTSPGKSVKLLCLLNTLSSWFSAGNRCLKRNVYAAGEFDTY